MQFAGLHISSRGVISGDYQLACTEAFLPHFAKEDRINFQGRKNLFPYWLDCLCENEELFLFIPLNCLYASY